MKSYLQIIFIFLLTVSCSKAKNAPQNEPSQNGNEQEEFIIGGRVVTKKSAVAATTVSLLDSGQGTLCTASLLTDAIAVTAAHCVSGNPQDMELSFGPKSTGNETRPVLEIAVQPAWQTHQNEQVDTGDLALIKFSGGIPTGAHAITVMGSNHKLSVGEIVTLAGYGISNGSTQDGAGRLRTVDVKIADPKYSRTEVSLDQRDGKGACHGDSGGPAFIQDNQGGLLLWGVTSRGMGDPRDQCNGYSIYTKLQPYMRWINSTVKNWNQ